MQEITAAKLFSKSNSQVQRCVATVSAARNLATFLVEEIAPRLREVSEESDLLNIQMSDALRIALLLKQKKVGQSE